MIFSPLWVPSPLSSLVTCIAIFVIRVARVATVVGVEREEKVGLKE